MAIIKFKYKKMKTIKIEAEFTYDDELFPDTKEEQDWFYNEILLEENLCVHSNEIGDEVGSLKISNLKSK